MLLVLTGAIYCLLLVSLGFGICCFAYSAFTVDLGMEGKASALRVCIGEMANERMSVFVAVDRVSFGRAMTCFCAFCMNNMTTFFGIRLNLCCCDVLFDAI